MKSKYTKESLGFKVGDKINITYYANEKEGMVYEFLAEAQDEMSEAQHVFIFANDSFKLTTESGKKLFSSTAERTSRFSTQTNWTETATGNYSATGGTNSATSTATA